MRASDPGSPRFSAAALGVALALLAAVAAAWWFASRDDPHDAVDVATAPPGSRAEHEAPVPPSASSRASGAADAEGRVAVRDAAGTAPLTVVPHLALGGAPPPALVRVIAYDGDDRIGEATTAIDEPATLQVPADLARVSLRVEHPTLALIPDVSVRDPAHRTVLLALRGAGSIVVRAEGAWIDDSTRAYVTVGDRGSVFELAMAGQGEALDHRGACRFDDLPAGAYRVVLERNADGARADAVRPCTVRAGRETVVRVDDAPRSLVEITGRVFLRREPVPYADLRFAIPGVHGSGVDAHADADGRFTARVEPGARYEGYVSRRIGVGGEVSVPHALQVTSGDAANEVRVDLPATTLRGTVTGPDGAPVPAVEVAIRYARPTNDASVVPDTTTAFAFVLTDEDGAFRAEGLPPGTYRLTVGEDAEFRRPTQHGRYARLDAVVSLVTTATCDLRVEAPFELHGRVVSSATGAPAPHMSVHARRADDPRREWFLLARTKLDGSFHARNVGAGAYVVVASPSKSRFDPHASYPAVVEVGAAHDPLVTLTVHPATELQIEVFRRDGEPVRARVVIRDDSGDALPDHGQVLRLPYRHRSAALPPGEYVVEALTEDGALLREAVVVNGDRPVQSVILLR